MGHPKIEDSKLFGICKDGRLYATFSCIAEIGGSISWTTKNSYIYGGRASLFCDAVRLIDAFSSEDTIYLFKQICVCRQAIPTQRSGKGVKYFPRKG